MSTTEATELTDVLSRVKNWSPKSRIVLARLILETLEVPQRPALGLPARSAQELIGLGVGDSPAPDDERPLRPTRGFSADQVIQLLHSDQPAPTGEECDRIFEEELTKKYSP